MPFKFLRPEFEDISLFPVIRLIVAVLTFPQTHSSCGSAYYGRIHTACALFVRGLSEKAPGSSYSSWRRDPAAEELITSAISSEPTAKAESQKCRRSAIRSLQETGSEPPPNLGTREDARLPLKSKICILPPLEPFVGNQVFGDLGDKTGECFSVTASARAGAAGRSTAHPLNASRWP